METSWIERRHQNQPQRTGDHRSPYQRDKARILHSAAFRRLQSKTQVLGIGIGDFYRTRLTHSLEASQIGQGIAGQLAIKYEELVGDIQFDLHLIEAICLAHDIGHPPFGHGGEIALNYMMRNHGGFEGNGQTFRIVTRLEPYTPNHGMDLCRRTLLGLVKYPGYLEELKRESEAEEVINTKSIKAGDWHPPKGLYLDEKAAFDWMLSPFSENDQRLFKQHRSSASKQHNKTQFKSFDCSIMELADDIAYSIHDLEDAIVMGIVRREEFEHEVVSPIRALDSKWFELRIKPYTDKLFGLHHYERKDAIGGLVNNFITNVEVNELAGDFEASLLRKNAVMPEVLQHTLQIFKNFVFKRVIKKSEIQQLEYKGQQVVMELFTAFSSDPERLLPDNTKNRWLQAQENNNGARVIADYISGMTDEFASRMHSNLFLPKNQGINNGQFY